MPTVVFTPRPVNQIILTTKTQPIAVVGPAQGPAGYTPVKGVDYFDGVPGADSTVPGPAGTTDHLELTNIGTNTHAQIDSALTTTTEHIANTSNPHGTTKAQVGLSAVPNTDFTAAVAANTAKVSFDSTSSTRLANTSGTNTGDNATNSQYSGLAVSKQDALVSGTTIKTINSVPILGSGDIVIAGGGSGVTDHTLLTNVGTNTHAQIDTAMTRLATTSGTNTGDNLVISASAPTPSVGAQVLWLNTTGGNITLNLVTGE